VCFLEAKDYKFLSQGYRRILATKGNNMLL